MNRRNAYLGVLKYHFQEAVINGADYRLAYQVAKRKAAEYVFNASTDKLVTWIAVW